MEIITRNKVKLIQWLCGEELILQYVHERMLVTQKEYIKVKSIQDPSANITELLDIILQKGDSVCVAFLELLKNDAVNESRPELKAWITTVDTSALAHKTEKTNPSQAGTLKITDDQEFLKKNRGRLIDKVKNVERIIDDLNDLSDEMAANIRAERTDQAKMRKVLEYTTSRKAAKLLVDALHKHANDVMEDLITV